VPPSPRSLSNLPWKRIATVLGGLFVLFLVLCGIAYAATDVPTPNKIATDQATRVLYDDGKEMGRIGKNRVIIPLSQVSKAAQNAVLAAENRDFYSEPGISPKGIARALFTNVKAGGVSQGGSTITQQYAKNAFLTQERTYTRKVKEVFIALKMSRTVSKDQILENYLNTIYFGRGAYGIQAAAETYFGVKAAALTPAQAAVLASSIRSPAAYDPKRHPERAQERWAYVLDGMVAEGKLTSQERARQRYPQVRAPGGNRSFPGAMSYIQEKVLAELEARGFDEGRISAGGLTVRTTINQKAQQEAIKAVEDEVPAAKKKDDPVAALASVEAGTGKVVAYYGGRQSGGFDYASDGKGVQPGSSMKPYTLVAALEKGTGLTTKLNGASPQTICGTRISNDEGDPPLGMVDLAYGLELSVNTVYYRLACETGADRVQSAAHAAGIPKKQPLADPQSNKPTAQITLGAGGYEVHVLDQAVGYATFAAKGKKADAYFVARVTDNDGNELYKAKENVTTAFSEGIAADATYAMQRVVDNGTGRRAKLDGRPTAGKTGTTQENTNAWFCGFTPQLATAVWVGRPSGAPLKGVLGSVNGVYGGTIPAKIFKSYMDGALEGKDVMSFPPRANVGQQQAPSSSPTPSATPTTASPTPTPSPTVTSILPTVVPTKDNGKPSKTREPSPTAEPTQEPTASPTPDGGGGGGGGNGNPSASPAP
jgi:membrane peptidoglycan carboxypeptidase